MDKPKKTPKQLANDGFKSSQIKDARHKPTTSIKTPMYKASTHKKK